LSRAFARLLVARVLTILYRPCVAERPLRSVTPKENPLCMISKVGFERAEGPFVGEF